MRKFRGLLANELVKTFSKVSSIIVLVVLAVFAVLFNYILYSNPSSGWVEAPYEFSNYADEIEHMKATGHTQGVNVLTRLQELGVPYGENGFREHALYEYFTLLDQIENETIPDSPVHAGYEEQAERLKGIIDKNDQTAYYRYMQEFYPDDSEAYAILIEQKVAWNSPRAGTIFHYISCKSLVAQDRENPAADSEGRRQQQVNRDNLLIAEYRIHNNVEKYTLDDTTNYSSDFWANFSDSASSLTVVSLLLIFIAAGIVASEFSKGTIKFLLINPTKRGKILAAKYTNVLIIGLVLVCVYFLLNLLLVGCFYGFGDIASVHLSVSGNRVIVYPSWLYVLQLYGINSVSIVTMATFAFAVSSLFRNTALAISLSMAGYLLGNTITMMLHSFGFDWARYILFANQDLNMIAQGRGMFAGQTLTFSLIVLGCYMAVFWLTAWDGFVRRDVK